MPTNWREKKEYEICVRGGALMLQQRWFILYSWTEEKQQQPQSTTDKKEK